MIVVDTNILAYHCLPGPRNAETEHLLRRHPEWAAPLLWRSEFRNILAGYLRRGALDARTAERVVLHAARLLRGGEHAVSDAAVLELVTRSPCSGYDCEFAALAEALGTVVITEDKALLAAFPDRCRSLAQAVAGEH